MNNSQQMYQFKNNNTPDVCHVHTRLTSDAKFGSQNKYKVEKHWGPKVPKQNVTNTPGTSTSLLFRI